MPLLTLKTQLMPESHAPGMLAIQPSCVSLLLPRELPPLWGASSTPVSITNLMQAASALSAVLTDPSL